MSTYSVSRVRNPVGPLLRDRSAFAAYGCAAVSILATFAISGVMLDVVGYHNDSEAARHCRRCIRRPF